MRFGLCIVSVVATAAAWTVAADPPADKPSAEPKGTPVELSITGKTAYPLDLGGKTPEQFKKMIEDAGNDAAKLPKRPALELKLVIKNTGDKPVTVWTKGDPVVIGLKLKGDGAVTAKPQGIFTQEFRAPEGVEIAPGKTAEIPLKELAGGFRTRSEFAYWTKPGEYELTATLKTGVTPPSRSLAPGGGAGEVTLTSAAVKIKIEAKK
jgi:hypothetical protein